MSASTSRSNGSQAACEPCRKRKLRCGHERPVCDRCHRRSIAPECWYHPAPLTKLSGAQTGVAKRVPPLQDDAEGAASGDRATDPIRRNVRDSLTRVRSGFTHSDAIENEEIPLPWSSLSSLDPTESEQVLPTPNFDDRGNATFAGDLECIIRVLSHVEHLTLIERLVHEYYAVGQIALVPAPLILPAISNLQRFDLELPILSESPATRRAKLSSIANRVLHLTSTRIETASSLSVAGFLALYSGTNLRLETIGLIYTIAARSCLLGLAQDDDRRQNFVQAMFQCSARCLRLARDLAPQVNDVMVWLAYENLRLTMNIQGHANPNVWRRLGDLSTDILALGFHHDTSNSRVPFFLAECRRRTFTAAYHIDKFLATLLDRPPRILRRYSNCDIPLDINDEECLAIDFHDVDRLRLGQTSDGWNANAQYSSSTWTRLRYHFSEYREDLLEYSFRETTLEARDKLDLELSLTLEWRTLSRRCRETWNSLPIHLRYAHDCWNSSLSTIVCLMLTDVYLLYLQTEFHIHRLLERSQSQPSLLLRQISADTISTILQLGACRDRALYLRRNFPSTVLCYGLPSAIVLANALKGISKGGFQALPTGLSRSSMIRSLSVFVSYLENIYVPGEANYLICMQASRVISRTLDEVLDSLSTVEVTPALVSASSRTNTDIPSPLNSLLMGADSMAMTDIDVTDGNEVDLMDLSNWTGNFDWIGAGGDPTIFCPTSADFSWSGWKHAGQDLLLSLPMSGYDSHW